MDNFEANFSPFEGDFSCILKPCSIFSVLALALFVKTIIFRHCLSFFDKIRSEFYKVIKRIEESIAENERFLSKLYETCIHEPSRSSLTLLRCYCTYEIFYNWLEYIGRNLVHQSSENEADIIQQICQKLNICIQINKSTYNTQENAQKILIILQKTSNQYSLQLTEEEKLICQSSEQIYINFFRHPYIYITSPTIKISSNSQESIINFSEGSTSLTDSLPKKTESTPVICSSDFDQIRLSKKNNRIQQTDGFKKSNFIRFNQRNSDQEEKCDKCKISLNVYNCSTICSWSNCYLCNKCRFEDLEKCILCKKPYGEYESTLKVVKLSYD